MTVTQELIDRLNLKPTNDTYIKVFIKGDTNDADYISESSIIRSIEEYEQLTEILEKIDSYGYNHDWENRYDYLTEDEISFMQDYVPCLNDNDVHTITETSFTFVINGTIYE